MGAISYSDFNLFAISLRYLGREDLSTRLFYKTFVWYFCFSKRGGVYFDPFFQCIK